MNYYTAKSNGGKRTCKYYMACGNTENCLRCDSFIKESRNGKTDKFQFTKDNGK